jgi:transcription antitermination factor NusG
MHLRTSGLGHKRPVSDGAELQIRVWSAGMASLYVNATSSAHCPGLPSSYWEPLWYAAYTSANHEKRVAEQLMRKSVEHFLPLYNTVRRWKDRWVQLTLPLFPGYVFVRIALNDRMQVLKVPGVAKLVGFNGMPTALQQKDIDALRTSLLNGLRAEPHSYLTVGRRVRVKSGPLFGMEGILLRRKSGLRVAISIELIQRSVAVDIENSEIEPI